MQRSLASRDPLRKYYVRLPDFYSRASTTIVLPVAGSSAAVVPAVEWRMSWMQHSRRPGAAADDGEQFFGRTKQFTALDDVIEQCRPGEKQGTASAELPPLEIVMWVGDNIRDFPDLDQDLRLAGRQAFVDFGRVYFLMPNPLYGSW